MALTFVAIVTHNNPCHKSSWNVMVNQNKTKKWQKSQWLEHVSMINAMAEGPKRDENDKQTPMKTI